jgi:hypothetical protein
MTTAITITTKKKCFPCSVTRHGVAVDERGALSTVRSSPDDSHRDAGDKHGTPTSSHQCDTAAVTTSKNLLSLAANFQRVRCMIMTVTGSLRHDWRKKNRAVASDGFVHCGIERGVLQCWIEACITYCTCEGSRVVYNQF